MKNIIRKTISCVLVGLLTLSFIGCLSGCTNDQAIIGKWYKMFYIPREQGCSVYYDEIVIQDKDVYIAEFLIANSSTEQLEIIHSQNDKEYGYYEKITNPKFKLINQRTLEYDGQQYCKMSDTAEMNEKNFDEIIKFFSVALRNENLLTTSQLKETNNNTLFRVFENGQSLSFDYDDSKVSFELTYTNHVSNLSERYYGVVLEHEEFFNERSKYGAWMPILCVIVKTDLDFQISAAHLLNCLYVTEDGVIKSSV